MAQWALAEQASNTLIVTWILQRLQTPMHHLTQRVMNYISGSASLQKFRFSLNRTKGEKTGAEYHSTLLIAVFAALYQVAQAS